SYRRRRHSASHAAARAAHDHSRAHARITDTGRPRARAVAVTCLGRGLRRYARNAAYASSGSPSRCSAADPSPIGSMPDTATSETIVTPLGNTGTLVGRYTR